MYSAEQVVNGIIAYADNEVMVKLPTTGKWVMGTIIGIASQKVHRVVETLQDNIIVQMLDVVDESGNIDVDTVVVALKEASEKYGNLHIDLPLVGNMAFTSSDVEKLRTYIG